MCMNSRSYQGFQNGFAEHKACVANGGNTSWLTKAVIVDIDGESQGRDDTWFRVVHPTITSERIAYKMEWTRDGKT
jgi:hypothetical protein